MNAATVSLILGLLGLIAQYAPLLAPKIKELFESLKGTDVVDITHEELVARIDAAISALPVWE
jgi:hypothetical protein